MQFYIVTPTYNALIWLKRCLRSVVDQVGTQVQVHHHVQDGGSSDGTPEWLAEWQATHADIPGYRFTYESGKDKGMYDAINRAWEKMPTEADVTAHLNSDEQYFPDALRKVAVAIEAHPDHDIALCTYLIVDVESRYICHRRPVYPHAWSSKATCEISTCSCFHRAEYFRKHGIRFDISYRSLADLILFRDITAIRPRFLMLPDLITGSFAVTGENLAWSEQGMKEATAYRKTYHPLFAKCFPLINKWVNFKRRQADKRCSQPKEYSLYMPGDDVRTTFNVKHPTAYWGMRSQGERD